jgi:dipeptidyl aminopeptidase/acylaminoacyl peptidase
MMNPMFLRKINSENFSRLVRVRRLRRLWVICTVGALSVSSHLWAAETQEASPLPISAALDARTFGGRGFYAMSFSPDGQWLAYVVTSSNAGYRPGVPSEKANDDIWITNTRTHESKNISGGVGDNWLSAWSPDGQLLAFVSDRESAGHFELWLWHRSGGEISKVSDASVDSDMLYWTPDSKHILLMLSHELRSSSRDKDAGNQSPSEELSSTVRVYRSTIPRAAASPPASSDPWSLDEYGRNLAVIDVVNGQVELIASNQRIARFLLSPDGLSVLYTSPRRFEKPGTQQILFDLDVTTLSTKQSRILATNIRLGPDGGGFSWSPDGKLVSYHTSGMEEKLRNCYVIKVQQGESRNVTGFSTPSETSDRMASNPLWDARGNLYIVEDDALWRLPAGADKATKIGRIPGRKMIALLPRGEGLLWTSQNDSGAIAITHDDEGQQDGFYRLNLDNGNSEKLLEKGQCYTCTQFQVPWAVNQDRNAVAFYSEDPRNDSDLWLSDMSFVHIERLTSLNPQFDRYEMGQARLIKWLSDDGMDLKGALLLPAGYEVGRRYPLVVWVYGGGLESARYDRFGFVSDGPLNMQLLATRGYAVLAPDSPQHEGTSMLDLVKTVLPGVNTLVEMGIADPDRLALIGQSNGGYSVLGLIVQTHRFKVAVEIDGMGDLIGHYGQMDQSGAAFGASLEHDQNGIGGSVWEFRQRYIENSPVFYLDRVDTPLLIVHGGSDSTVAPFLGDEIFVDLRRLGKEVEYAKYEGEGHSPLYWSYANQDDFCHRVIAWLASHLQ